MMARLEAEESLLATERIAIGAGSLSSREASARVRRWSHTAHPPGEKTAAPATTSRLNPGVLAAMGIRVVPHGG